MGRSAILWALAALASSGCSGPPAPEKAEKPVAIFEGLPLSGNLVTAPAAGFGNCIDGTKGLRCRKEGVRILGAGPFVAAVDFDAPPKNGSARFDHVTLWHPTDQSAAVELGAALSKAGWKSCLTADAERYWRPPSPLRIAIDTNYWGSRRIVISAPPPSPTAYCP